MEENSVVKITNDIKGKGSLKQELKNLLDDENLNNIKDSVSGFNPFRVLKLEHYEIRHSNFLAWLLNPQESHGLDVVFLKKFLEKINEINKDKAAIIPIKTINKDNITIKREWQNIDILIEGDNFVCVIENKIYCRENGTQLQKYRTIIENEFSDKTAFYIYLTLNEETPSDEDYKNITYSGSILPILEDIIIIIDSAKEQVKSFIKQYINILEYDLQLKDETNNETISEISKISEKHKTILDYLYEIKDNLYDVHFQDNELDNDYQQKIKAIQVVFSFQINLQDKRDEKIRETLCTVFDEDKIIKHGGWAYKLNLEDETYPFKQVDYTSRPFENIMVRFYCGITANESRKLINKIKNKNDNFIENLKSLKCNYKNSEVQTGIIFKYKGSPSQIGKILIKEEEEEELFYEFISYLNSDKFDKDYIGEWNKSNEKLSTLLNEIKFQFFENKSEEKIFNIVQEYNQEKPIIFLPVLYLFFDVNNDEKEECFKKYTRQGFELFGIGKEFEALLKSE